MAKKLNKVTRSLKELGELQITDWDLKELLNRDLKDLEITEALRQLGSRKVIDWEVDSSNPVVNRLANQEVDLVEWVKRAAHYKINDWDFKKSPANPEEQPGAVSADLKELSKRITAFIGFTIANLIDEPDEATVIVNETAPGTLHFTLLVAQGDIKDTIGRKGRSGAALRRLIKDHAQQQGVTAYLQILSHQEKGAPDAG